MTEEEFYATNPARRDIGWTGYGVSWIQSGIQNISVIYAEPTGELFAIRNGSEYLVLASLSPDAVEERLRGWAKVHLGQRGNSFEWVIARI